MSIFTRFAGFVRTKLSHDTSEGYYQGGPNDQTAPISEVSALGLSAVWACQNIIGGSISTLPLQLFHAKSNGVVQPATDHWAYRLINSDPNYELTSTEFWEYISASIELHGNGYAQKVKGVIDPVSSLHPINPENMQVRRKKTGDLEYRYILEGKRFVSTQDEILHFRGNFPTSLGGQSTLSLAASTLTSARDADTASRNQFKNGMRPSGIMSFPRPLDGIQRKKVKEGLRSEYQGAVNDGRPMVLDNGVEWVQLSISAKDAQMLESRRFSIEEIARIFGVPPFMIGHAEKSSSWGKGLEQQVLAFLKFTLRKRLKRIEKTLEKQLLSPAERARGMYIRFNMEGLLRGDSSARASFYEVLIRNGVMTINQARELEDWEPVDGGDVPRVQMQNIPVSEADGNSLGES